MADAIPELGHGGREIAGTLMMLASKVREGEVIVDIGPYLGSTTAYLALGAPAGTPIHAFDAWDANLCDLKKKSRLYHGAEVPENFLPDFLHNLKPFGANITPHRQDVRQCVWSGDPIGLYVDDIGAEAEYNDAKMAVFGEHLVVGAKLVLMDYFWFETKCAIFNGQRDYFEARRERYRFTGRFGKVTALFEVVC